MPNHKIDSSYSFTDLVKAYGADEQSDSDAHFLLFRGEEILALCLRQKLNPRQDEVWVGDDGAVAEWGAKLAALKDQRTVPLYYSQRGRNLYQFKGQHLITGDTQERAELDKRNAPVGLSRVVFMKPLPAPKAP